MPLLQCVYALGFRPRNRCTPAEYVVVFDMWDSDPISTILGPNALRGYGVLTHKRLAGLTARPRHGAAVLRRTTPGIEPGPKPRRRLRHLHKRWSLRACDWSEAGLARPRRKGEHNTDVPTCHSGDNSTYVGVVSRAAHMVARQVDRCAQRTARPHGASVCVGGGGGIGFAIAMLGSTIFPANTKFLDALVDDR